MSLSQAQYRAITHLKGPCLVLAGPGSGKTLTIVKRIEYLIKKHQINPEDILVVTFTKAAAGEMRERFYSLMKSRNAPVTFGTFHSIFYGILKWSYHLSADSFIGEPEQFRLISQICESLNVDADQELTADILREIGRQKSRYPQVDHAAVQFGSILPETFDAIRKVYDDQKERIRKYDFDDMLLKCCELFHEQPDILKKWQERFPYILIDEFQDINPVQYQVMQMLSAKQQNLFVVGDDDQSIYSFRGAEPSIMLGFEKDYPDAVKIILDINFRSTDELVRNADKIIRCNQNRFMKHIKANQEGGDKIRISEFADTPAESKFVAEELRRLLEQGTAAEQMAVLYRSKADVGDLMETLMEYGIPFYMKEQFTSIYDHFIGRDMISYIRLALGGKERTDYLRICNRPNRYIKRDSLDERSVTFETLRCYYEEQEWILPTIDQFEEDVKILGDMAPFAALTYIRKRIGYDCFLSDYAAKYRMKAETLFEVADELVERARKYKSLSEWIQGIDLYNQRLLEEKNKRGRENIGVALMSMHGAKGLEFETVFIISANDDSIPHKKAVMAEEIEEERRIFYVAVTRAKQQLFISYVNEKNGKEQSPSRFLEQISD
ncbi:MAG: ATP-dependent helicase [Lachnospiraceae bacterium]